LAIRWPIGPVYFALRFRRRAPQYVVITIQRVRVRWKAAERAAPQAKARRGLSRPRPLPASLPVADVVIHDVLAGPPPRAEVLSGDLARARDIDLWLELVGAALVVDRLPGRAAYPRPSGMSRLFTLAPGEVGEYRANFRLTGCSCDPSWYYEDWLLRVANGPLTDHVTRAVDHRVHLYGGRAS
jgi:hypothetical protein